MNHSGPALAQTSNGTIVLFWSANTTGIYKVYFQTNIHGVWSKTMQATSGPFNDCNPTAALGKDNSLWLFWSRGSPCYSGTVNLYYKTQRSGLWSGETQLTFDNVANLEPKATVSNDGRIWVTFAQYMSGSQNSQVFYTVYDGLSWSPETRLISSNLFDDHPSILQDRNGTLWLFWTRELNLGAGNTEDKIFGRTSYDNGVTWSKDTQITFDPACCTVDDWASSAVQGFDHTIWLFYSSSYPLGGGFDIYYIQSNQIFPVHHVSVSIIETPTSCPFPLLAPSSPSCLYPGGFKEIGESPVVIVNVTITNPGDFSETVAVQLTAVNGTSYSAGSLIATLSPGGKAVLSFTWNTTRSEAAGLYGLSATVSGIPSETLGNQEDNSLLAKNLVHLIPLGDVDQDGSVTFIDASIVARAFQSDPMSPNWNPYADIDGDNYINFLDVSAMARGFGVRT